MKLLTQVDIHATLAEHFFPVKMVKFAVDGETLVSGDVQMQAVVWRDSAPISMVDLRSRNSKFRPSDRLRGAALAPDGASAFIAAGDSLKFLDLKAGKTTWAYRAPNMLCFLLNAPTAVVLGASGNALVTFEDGSLEVWTPAGRRLGRWTDNDTPNKMAVMPGGESAIGTDGFTLTRWLTASAEKVDKHDLHERIFAVAASPSESLIALRLLSEVLVLSAEDMREVGRFHLRPGAPILSFHPGKAILACGEAGGLTIRTATGQELISISDETYRVVSAEFSPDGGRVATGCSDGVVRVWNLASMG